MHPKNVSQRQQKAAEFVRRFLSEALLRGEVRNVPFLDVTVSDVYITPDFKSATVYIVTRAAYAKAQPKNEKNILIALKAASSHLRHLLSKQMEAKAVPRLQFEKDMRLEYAERITRLIDEVAVESVS
jgi:ribosome-binding factor A